MNEHQEKDAPADQSQSLEGPQSLEGAWWLQGDEQCPHCLQRYVYEHRIHCRYCDEPMCPECVETVVETREWICPSCNRQSREKQ